MNKLFQNKFFIAFLVLAVVIYGLSVKIAQASGVFNFITTIVIVVVTAVIIFTTAGLGGLLAPSYMIQGGLLLTSALINTAYYAMLNTMVSVVVGSALCAGGVDSAFWSGCGGNIGGITITAPMLIPFGKGECRVGLVLPSFYEPWPSQSVGAATGTDTTAEGSRTTYANYLSNDINKLGGEYKGLPLSDVSLAGNLENNGFVIEYEKSFRVYASTTVPRSMSMNQFRQEYGDIALKIQATATSTPEQFIKFGNFFSTSTQSGYKVSQVSDVDMSSIVCSAPRTETDSNCDLVFRPKGQTRWYSITNDGSSQSDSQRASFANRPTFRAIRIIPLPLVEDGFDVELYRYSLPKPDLTGDTLNQYLTKWFYNTTDLSSKGFNIAPGPGIYNFSLSGQNQLKAQSTSTFITGTVGDIESWMKKEGSLLTESYARYFVPPDDGHFYRFANYPEPTETETTWGVIPHKAVKAAAYKYKNVCASGRCNLIDPNPPEGEYLIYEAKIKGNFGQMAGAEDNRWLRTTDIRAKYLNTDNRQSSWFSFFWNDCDSSGCNLYKGDGNIAYGPLAPITLPDEDACEIQAQVRIVAVKCDSILISVVVPLADQNNYSGYDVYRNGSLVEANVPIVQTLFEDKGLTGRTSYSYKVVLKTTDGVNQEYNLSSVRTLCPPECGFSANPNQLVFPQGDTRISWDCDNADSCSLSATALPQDLTLSQFCQKNSGSLSENVCQVSPVQGTSQNLTLDQTTTFILSCQNQDGAAVKTATVDFLRPKRMEVIPR